MQVESKQARLFLIFATIGAVLTLLFALLWLFARNDKSDLARIAQDEAAVCRDAWKTFSETGDDADAKRALASLYAFSRDAELLMTGSSREEYPSYCMNVFRLLNEKPELCAPCAKEMQKQMGFLAGDIYRVSAYAELYKLAERLERGDILPDSTETVD